VGEGFSVYDNYARTVREVLRRVNDAPEDSKAIDDFDREFRGTLNSLRPRIDEMATSGRYTAQGIAFELQPSLLKEIDKFENSTTRNLERLEGTRQRIESGRQVRSKTRDGWDTVNPPEPTPVAEQRAGEIRTWARSLSASDRRELIRRAYADDDAETLRALESAPKAMELLAATDRQALGALRMQASGWLPSYEAARVVIAMRQQVAADARIVLGQIDAEPIDATKRVGGQVVLTAEQAREPETYRAAKAQAARAGAELVVSNG
jgi:hypothetical protein